MGQHQLIHHGHPMSTPIRSAGGLIRGLSLGELSPRSPEVALTPFDFDTKKVATHGTLKRLKLVKSPTDTQLFVPNQALTLEHLGTNGIKKKFGKLLITLLFFILPNKKGQDKKIVKIKINQFHD